MSMYSRRQFLTQVGALGAAVASPGAWAASGESPGLSTDGALRLEAEAAGFANPLRLPGSSGLFGVLPGQRTPILAYAVESGGKKFINPALLARQGDQMRVKLINRIDQPTVIHWHGLSVDSRNDGNGLHVVAPGQRMDYAFTVQDRSSMYWYHPHAHGFIPRQAYHGLASLLFVEDDDEAVLRKELALALGESEIPLVLQDKEFDAQGRLQYAPSAAQSFGGWVGSRLMVNLTERPVLKAGRRIVRFRLLNGSNARSYRLAFLQQGQALGFYLAGTDGGLLAEPVRLEQTFLSPGQRLDLLVDFREAQAGRPVTLASLPFDPMHQEGGHDTGASATDHSQHGAAHGGASLAAMAMEGDARALIRIDLATSGTPYDRRLPARLSSLAAPVEPAGTPRRMRLGHDGQGHWMINGGVFDHATVPVTVKRGARETWLIENAERSMPHPMHLHGFSFRVLERLGSPAQIRPLAGARGLLPQDLGVVDTLQVWPGESVKVAIDFSHPHAGDQDYVFHCHTLEHAETGMMLRYQVKA